MKIFLIYIFWIVTVLFLGCTRKGKKQDHPAAVTSITDTLTLKAPAQASPEKNTFDLKISDLEDPYRGKWQNPTLVLNKLGPLKGKVVADLGCGTGYFTFPIASRAKKVIAIDIQQQYLDYIEDRKLEASHSNADKIETRLTVEDDPDLKPEEADVVLMVNVYYYLKDRPQYMKKVLKGIKKGGILVLVDFKPGDLPVGPAENKVPVRQVLSDLKKAGFKILEVDLNSLQYQYIIKAQR